MKYPNSHCSLSPSSSHFFVVIDRCSGIWQCKYCLVAKWLPTTWEEATSFSYAVEKLGVEKAYKRFLSRKPNIVKKLVKIGKEAKKGT